MTDRVSLIKANGDRQAGIPASVQREIIFVNDASLLIEPGDVIERVASNGLRELYEVTDPGFYEKIGGFKAHYQIRFRRISARPAPSSSPTAGKSFYSPTSDHDAYVRLRDIVRSARRSISIVDSYTDSSLFTLLAIADQGLAVRILTLKPPKDFALEAEKFGRQYRPASICIRTAREFHDRFIIVDGSGCYHLGASIKDAGQRAFMIQEVLHADDARDLLAQFERTWRGASPL
jgi:hypothetical protein